MILYFDEKTLQLNARLGAGESYTPNDEVRDIMLRAEELERRKREFLDVIYNPEIKKLIESIEKINKENNPDLEKLRKS